MNSPLGAPFGTKLQPEATNVTHPLFASSATNGSKSSTAFVDSARTFGPPPVNPNLLDAWNTEQKSTVFGNLGSSFADGGQRYWNSAVAGVSAAFSRTQESASRTQEQVQSVTNRTLQRYVYSTISAFVGVLFILASITFLPLLVIKPQKFALLFTIGSILLINSAGLFTGYNQLLGHLIERQRIAFSVGYLGSLVVTLYTTLILRSYFVTIVFSIIQLVCLVTLLASYYSGSAGVLGFWKSIFYRAASKVFGWTGAENHNRWTILPL